MVFFVSLLSVGPRVSGSALSTVWGSAAAHPRIHQGSCYVCPEALRQGRPRESKSVRQMPI